jgi:hypothetical protein
MAAELHAGVGGRQADERGAGAGCAMIPVVRRMLKMKMSSRMVVPYLFLIRTLRIS